MKKDTPPSMVPDGELLSILNIAAAFSRTINQQVAVADIVRRVSWLIPKQQGSNNAVGQLVPIDFSVTMRHMAKQEQPMYEIVLRECFNVMATLAPEVRGTVSFSFNLHSTFDGHEQLIMHRATPLRLEADGSVRYMLSLLMPSLTRQAGDFHYAVADRHMVFDFGTQRWHPLQDIKLKLTHNERQMLILSARGYTLEEISEQLNRAVDTIKLYRRQVFDKLRVSNITEALYAAQRYRLL